MLHSTSQNIATDILVLNKLVASTFTPKPVPNKMGRQVLQPKSVEIFYNQEQLKNIFEKHDTKKDGKLSMKELKSAFQELQSRLPRFRAEVAMRKCDKNNDGYIEFGKELDAVVAYAKECGYTIA